jgi:hypothetical protein
MLGRAKPEWGDEGSAAEKNTLEAAVGVVVEVVEVRVTGVLVEVVELSGVLRVLHGVLHGVVSSGSTVVNRGGVGHGVRGEGLQWKKKKKKKKKKVNLENISFFFHIARKGRRILKSCFENIPQSKRIHSAAERKRKGEPDGTASLPQRCMNKNCLGDTGFVKVRGGGLGFHFHFWKKNVHDVRLLNENPISSSFDYVSLGVGEVVGVVHGVLGLVVDRGLVVHVGLGDTAVLQNDLYC